MYKNTIMEPSGAEVSIGQRLKFIMNELGYDIRSFSKALDVGDTTIRNYFNRGSNPNADFLAKLTNTFERVNLTWLLTGQGQYFFPSTSENHLTPVHNQKNFRSSVVGKNQDTATQQQNFSSNTELELVKNKLALAEKDIESLQTQLQMKDAVIAAKDETINLLSASYNRSS